MSTYPQRVAENILPLSVGSTLPEAFEEWSFAEETVDHEEPIETCELCDQEALRYHFRIENALNQNQLWVGSQCILKFGVSVFEQGRRLTPAETKRKLDRLTNQMRLESCLRALKGLIASEPTEILESALKHYARNKSLTPKFAFVVLWRLQENHIDHSPSFFKISLRTHRQQFDLRTMPENRVHVIWPALTSSQRKMAIRMGHTPPRE